MEIKPIYILIAVLVLAILYVLFAFPKSDSAPPPVIRAPTPEQAQAQIPAPLQAVKGPISTGAHRVQELNSEDEVKAWVSNGAGVLLVYAPWCGHCKTMMPGFESASLKTDVRFARIEGQKAPGFMRDNQIRGFPSIFVNSKTNVLSRHQGGRDEPSLLAAAASGA
jgi:thiol-disulfide isomerase/thioredoxin